MIITADDISKDMVSVKSEEIAEDLAELLWLQI